MTGIIAQLTGMENELSKLNIERAFRLAVMRGPILVKIYKCRKLRIERCDCFVERQPWS